MFNSSYKVAFEDLQESKDREVQYNKFNSLGKRSTLTPLNENKNNKTQNT